MMGLWKWAYSKVEGGVVSYNAYVTCCHAIVNTFGQFVKVDIKQGIHARCRRGRYIFSCAQMLNWVLKLFSFRDIMSKVRIANSGGKVSLRPFFARKRLVRPSDESGSERLVLGSLCYGSSR